MANLIKLANISSSTVPADDMLRYRVQMTALLGTIEGTIPGSRGFGVSADVIDLPPMRVRNRLAVDLAEKANQYIERIYVQSVDILDTDEGGNLKVGVTIERRLA